MAQSLRGGQEQVRGPLLVVRRGNIRIGDLDGEFDPVLGDMAFVQLLYLSMAYLAGNCGHLFVCWTCSFCSFYCDLKLIGSALLATSTHPQCIFIRLLVSKHNQ